MENNIFEKMMQMVEEASKNPENFRGKNREEFEKLVKAINKMLGVSDHTKWTASWFVEKYNTLQEKNDGIRPYQVVHSPGNIVLDNGANQLLRLLIGDATATAYSTSNAYIYVGNDDTAENASQTGIIATEPNKAYANMEVGYPKVQGRSVIFRATFGDEEAKFDWREVVVTNGTGVGAVALNRKVPTEPLGKKGAGAWTMELTVTLQDI